MNNITVDKNHKPEKPAGFLSFSRNLDMIICSAQYLEGFFRFIRKAPRPFITKEMARIVESKKFKSLDQVYDAQAHFLTYCANSGFIPKLCEKPIIKIDCN